MKGEHNPLLVVKITIIKGKKIWTLTSDCLG